MTFIQIVEYETEQPDQMRALADSMRAGNSSPRWNRLTTTRDRNHPNRYTTIVEFPSWEVAQESNADPGTQDFARQMSALCTTGPTFTDLDVEQTLP